MRNPLKKIQQKINLRLASKATQHKQQQQKAVVVGKDSPPKQPINNQALPENESCTSLCQFEDGDPLFGNIIDRKIALMDSKKGNRSQNNNKEVTTAAAATTTKKKKRGRLSFGGRKSIGSFPKPQQGPLYQEPSQSQSQSPSKQQEVSQALTRTPEEQEEEKGTDNQKAGVVEASPTTPPPKQAAQEDAPSSPESPSSHLHIPAPPMVQRSDAMSAEAALAAQQNDKTVGDAKEPKRTVLRSMTPPPNKPQQQQQLNQNHHYVHLDPNVERIAKAAAALDNTGNEAFERGEFDKAMQIYSKALKLKKRTLTNMEQQNGSSEEPDNKPPENTPVKQPPIQTEQSHQPQQSKSKDGSSPAAADDLWISVATSINNIGYLRQQSGQASAEETMQAYQNSLQIKRRVLGKDNLSVGKTLNNLGTVHYLKRDYKEALKHYKEALQIMKTTLGAYHLDVGTVHSNIGDVYWAQSGDAKVASSNNNNNNATTNCPQRNYQASRDSALRHYRHSLEIRWEQLQDHHDPKVIRLLEKIAALEMGESFLALVQINQKYRPDTLGGNTNATNDPEADADEAMEQEHSNLPPVEQELQTLHEEVKKDVQTMDLMERKMAIDMVKDKLRLIREMKNLSNLDIYNLDLEEDLSMADDPFSSPSKSPLNKAPLSPVQRTEALSALKMRLNQLRESRKKGTNNDHIWYKSQASSDLKEIDGSQTHQYLSQKASNFLNRFNQTPGASSLTSTTSTVHAPPAVSTEPGKGLDMLRNFSLGHPLPSLDTASDDEGKATKAFSPRTSNTLNEGIGALRSLSLNTNATATEPAPWLAASSTVDKQPLVVTDSPTTSLPTASMASF